MKLQISGETIAGKYWKKRDLYALHNLPVGTIIEFKSENDMLSGIKKGDIVRLTKLIRNFQKNEENLYWVETGRLPMEQQDDTWEL